ncbi:MAG: BamA/TamA family outer membrane protein, partial [Hyphomicrobium sp.]
GSVFGNKRAEKIIAAASLADDASIRSAVGASILWNSPVGPLRLDYAIPLTKETYDEEQRFRFGASTKF